MRFNTAKIVVMALVVCLYQDAFAADVDASEPLRYTAQVPDTLDLVQRAHFAINGLTGQIVKVAEGDYELFWKAGYAPPEVGIHMGQWTDVSPRGLESLCGLRVITGSTYNIELEEHLLQAMLSRIGQDGLLYNAPFRIEAPWRFGGIGRGKMTEPREYGQVHGSALLLNALIYRYQRDGEQVLLEKAQALARGLVRIAITRDDYAYYPATHRSVPTEFTFFKESGWADTREAKNEFDGAEGAITGYIGMVVLPLCEYVKLTGDPDVFKTVTRLVRYMMKPRFWAGSQTPWSDRAKKLVSHGSHGGAVRRPAGMFQAHLAATAYALNALAIYGEISHDPIVKEFTRQAYEHYRSYSLAPIGCWGENIANTIPIMIAIKLSDSGVGDYWEDVDRYVRNTMVEDQFIDADRLKAICRERGLPLENTYDIARSSAKTLGWTEDEIQKIPPNLQTFTIERLLGLTRHDSSIDSYGTLDPTQNSTQVSSYHEPYYCAWEGITRYQDGVAHINLLLNRASAWLDLDSYLPYEGKVIIHNKTCQTLAIRIPGWVNKTRLSCRIINQENTSDAQGQPAPYYWTGNYITLQNLNNVQKIIIEFPMAEYTETYYILGQGFPDLDRGKWFEEKEKLPRYVANFKGNTCIQLDFPNRRAFKNPQQEGLKNYPVYQRDYYRANQAPMKTTTRYISANIIKW